MTKISDLTKTIQNKTSEQAKNTEQIVNDVFKTLNESLTSKASESVSLIKTDLDANQSQIQEILNQHKTSVQQELEQALIKHKVTWARIGGLGSLIVLAIMILVLGLLYLTVQVRSLASEKARLDKALQQMPAEAKILDKVKLTEMDGYYYIRSKDSITTAYTNKDGQMIMKIKAD